METRAWLRSKLEQIGLEPRADMAGNMWAPIEGESDAFVIVGSHIDAVPDGGWLDGALGLMTALEVVRQLTRRRAAPDRGAVRRLGRRRGGSVLAQPARLVGVRRDLGAGRRPRAHGRERRGAR